MERTKESEAKENTGGKPKGEHQWNSCGSETGKDERKPTESRVRELKGKHGKPGGTERENRSDERSEGAAEKPLRGEAVKRTERKKQKAE